MLRHTRMYGSSYPGMLRCSSGHTKQIAHAICSRFKEVLRINVMEDIPKTCPEPCHENNEVKEILLVEHLVCVLMKTGIARCYDSTDGRLLCELNPTDDRSNNFAAVHTIVHNPTNRTIIIAYSQIPAHLRCKVILVESLKLGKLDSPTYSYNFECVVLQHPAFFEFCGTNKRIGAADLCKHVYRFWNMNNYELVFEIKGKGYQEIRVSDGVVVMLSQPRHNYIPLSLYDIEDGTLLATRHIEIVQHRELQFLELLVTQLLIKQHGGPVRVYDILRGDGFIVQDTINFQPTGFVFYDATPPIICYESSAPVSSKLSYRPRKFFTLSKSLIEFWELTRYNLVRTNQLVLQGMDNPDICCHSLWANLLFVRAFKEQPLFGSITASPSSDSTQTNPLCHHHPKLLRRNERVHTPSKMSKESCEADILKQNEETLQKHGILLFTLDGSNYLGEIDQEIIDSNIETLALSNDLSVIACGSDEGEVSIMRMPNYIING
ncbi:hypothetical protein BBOV_II005860 [Babesia bovis T2Bo]|uniref:hypothetical protein n=1 Tax=Babesia bovis T2Bo TaxID=484906 RepID=UPI001C35516A|nr:hypothetical protein BBOV_II005860 [Babesia bovis T2Bo]EDO06536.2 hypothetical protein BBOV_II005860 [Babesia bovis T2Bo]